MNEFDLEKLNQITDKVLKAEYIPNNKSKIMNKLSSTSGIENSKYLEKSKLKKKEN